MDKVPSATTFKISLYENIHGKAVEMFSEEKILCQTSKAAIAKEEHKSTSAIGIRSASKIDKTIVNTCFPNGMLQCIGCYCIGTDQVDLKATAKMGIPVFNAPYSSTRSVAELVIGQIISLARKMSLNLVALKNDKWEKNATGCYEVRGKTIGIIGYGNIGSTVGMLAESLGMRVVFYDIHTKLIQGNHTRQVSTLEACLSEADFVTLHVPGTPSTKNMMDAKRINQMKDGAFLLNSSRGNVVVIEDVVAALKSNKLAGFYADVFPYEPKENGPWCNVGQTSVSVSLATSPDETKQSLSELSSMIGTKNVILSPHIGGSTENSQKAIAEDVTNKIIAYLKTGATIGCVNLPQLKLESPKQKPDLQYFRIMHFHENVPGVAKSIISAISKYNIVQQLLSTLEDVGYLITDIECDNDERFDEVCFEKELSSLPHTLRCRVLKLHE